jgi:hypothetical protein
MHRQNKVNQMPPRHQKFEILITSYRCKHLCCREGLDKRPKPQKKKGLSSDKGNEQVEIMARSGLWPELRGNFNLDKMASATLKATPQTRRTNATNLERVLRKGGVEIVDLACEVDPPDELAKLRRLHERNSSGTRVTTLPKKEPKYSFSGNSTSGTRPYLSFTPINGYSPEEQDTDLPSPRQLLKTISVAARPKAEEGWELKPAMKRAKDLPSDTDRPKKRAWFESSSPRDQPSNMTETDEVMLLESEGTPKGSTTFSQAEFHAEDVLCARYEG